MFKQRVKMVVLAVLIMLFIFPQQAFAVQGSWELLCEIVGLNWQSNAQEQKYVSRLEFVTAVVKGFYPETDFSETKATFSDTDDKYAEFAAEERLVNGIDGQFYPNDAITYNQAVKVLDCAIGCKAEGDYPIGFLKAARDIGLIENEERADFCLTYNEAAELIISGLNLYKVSYNDSGSAVYDNSKFIRKLGKTVVNGEAKNVITQSFPIWDSGKMPSLLTGEKIVPSIDAYLVEGNNMPAVVFFPGGAYMRMSAIESAQIPEFLNSCGISVFLVNYRVKPNNYEAITGDALEAMRIIKERANEFNVNPEKIGVMGCSAGGHLAAYVSTVGALSEETRPNFAILGYSVISMTDDLTHIDSRTNFFGTAEPSEKLIEKYSNENNVSEKTPATFIFCALGDSAVKSENSAAYAYALKKCGISCELHMYPERVHGFASGYLRPRVWEWQSSCRSWLRSIGVI